MSSKAERLHEEKIDEESLIVYAQCLSDDISAHVNAEAIVKITDSEGVRWEGSAHIEIKVRRRGGSR